MNNEALDLDDDIDDDINLHSTMPKKKKKLFLKKGEDFNALSFLG